MARQALMLFRIALRNLTRQRRRTLLVLLAVGLGVTAVVGVRGFLNGLQASLVLGFAEGTVGALQIHKKGFLQSLEAAPLSPNIELTGELFDKIQRVEGVRAATPRIAFPGMIAVGDESTFAMIVAVDPEREVMVCPRRRDHVTTGSWLSAASPKAPAGADGDPPLPPSLMGMELARSLGAAGGQSAAILTNDIDGVMNAVDTSLAGTLAAPTQGERKLVLIPLAAGQELLRMPGRATEIAVAVHELERVDEVADRLRAALGPDWEVHTWQQLAAVAKDVVETQNTALGIITSIFLIVILMGVANALLTSVLERVREIGTMMAVGARRRQILALFVMEAAVLGILGAALGSLAGTLIVSALAVNGIELTTPGASTAQHIVPFVELRFLVRMFVLCGVGASIAALWPAWRASRLRPVEALSHA
jgi:putative ABC transport system permease protein